MSNHMAASGVSNGAGAQEPSAYPPPALPASVVDVYHMTRAGTQSQRRKFANSLLERCKKPKSGRVLLGHGGFGAVFRVTLPKANSASKARETKRRNDYIAVKTVFNWGLSTSRLETNDSQKEFDVLARLPEHRNLARIVFECVCPPPVWMVRMLPDPSLVCVDDGDDDEDEEELPSGGASAPLHPRKAQMVGMELLKRRMCDHLAILEEGKPGSMPDDVLVQLSSDIAEGVHHLLQHGVVHRDLKLDNVLWDSNGGPEGVGRAVLIDLGCSLRVYVDAAGSGGVAAAAAKSSSSFSSSSAASSIPTTGSLQSHGYGADSTESAAMEALDRVTYRYLKDGGDGIGGNQAHLAPEVLDGWHRGAAGNMDAVVPFGKQASWGLGLLLHELATGGQHPFGDRYPVCLQDGSKARSGQLATALHACKSQTAGHDALSKRPLWYTDVVKKLLCVHPEDRMSMAEAVRLLRSMKLDGPRVLADCDISEYLPVLVAGGAGCDAAVGKVRAMADSYMATQNWDGVYRVLRQLETCAGATLEYSSAVRKLVCEICKKAKDHVMVDTKETKRIVGSLRSCGGAPLSHEMATMLLLWICSNGDKDRTSVIDAGALPGLVALLGSGKGREAECAAGALWSVACGSDTMKQSVVDAGALPGLVALLGSGKGREAECATGALRNVANRSDAMMQSVVDAGALPGLVALLGSDRGREAECAAGALWSVGNGSDAMKQSVVDAGALPGLVVLLGSGKGRGAECAAGALWDAANGSDVTKQSVVDAGALPGLVALLGSGKGREAECAAGALWNVVNGSDVTKQSVVVAGALPGLVALLGSGKGREAECATGALQNVAFGSDAMKQAVVDAGALPGLVALLGSGKGRGAECAAGALRIVTCGSDAMKQSVVDAGALPGLVALLGSGKGREAECAAGALWNVACGSDAMKQSVVDAGALPGLVALLGSGKGREAERAAGALRSVASGSDVTKQSVVDAGALPGLVALLGSGKAYMVQGAAEALRGLAAGSVSLKQSVVNAHALTRLVALLGFSNEQYVAAAAGTLLLIAVGSNGLAQAVVDAGAVDPLKRLRDFGSGDVVHVAGHAISVLARMARGVDPDVVHPMKRRRVGR